MFQWRSAHSSEHSARKRDLSGLAGPRPCADAPALAGNEGSFMHDREPGQPLRLDRRRFLSLGGVAAAGLLIPGRAFAAAAARPAAPAERVLSFFHTHTGERLKTAYCCGGVYQPEALAEVNHFLRDFRVNEERPIEPKLLDLLHELGGTLQTDSTFHVISGYRSAATNAMLRERGGATSGVAPHSLHMVGQAIDIRVPGIKLDRLRDAATSLKIGGCGYYPGS